MHEYTDMQERENKDMTLTTAARKGERLEIVSIQNDDARIQALRFGLGAGAVALCVTKVPGGPIVLKSGRQEIAIGRKLADSITVRKCV